uniref:Uncharacterized protein n=1 Tax=Amphimedon queenslandica TaxID=400682 RepID=A0A1X7VUN2_AMPQE
TFSSSQFGCTVLRLRNMLPATFVVGYFDLVVSNMLPEIEGCSISGNKLLTRSKYLKPTIFSVY